MYGFPVWLIITDDDDLCVLNYVFFYWCAMCTRSIDSTLFAFPSRCETNEDGSLSLHYYTIRPGLYPIVLGKV